VATSKSSVGAFLGQPFVGSSQSAFVAAAQGESHSLYAYTIGFSDPQIDAISAYLTANALYVDNQTAYVAGAGGLVTSQVAAFIGAPVVRSSVSVRFGGDGSGAIVAERDYMELKASDASVLKRFRVLAQGYDDGTSRKAESLDRTIGGGVDHSVGAVYVDWNPVIRVRHTEVDSNYGTLAELLWFYELDDPSGTPSNDIIFLDHHDVEHTVHLVGDFQKSLMGVRTEGTEAWSLVKVQMVAV
jgi:hypothetical protein